MRIKDLLLSAAHAELLELCAPPGDTLDGGQTNWFTAAAVQGVRRQFVFLDEDGDGLLSSRELVG